jgi:hypothetical protein
MLPQTKNTVMLKELTDVEITHAVFPPESQVLTFRAVNDEDRQLVNLSGQNQART